jgi:hypothetical protein
MVQFSRNWYRYSIVVDDRLSISSRTDSETFWWYATT